jgi:hypothetical protein
MPSISWATCPSGSGYASLMRLALWCLAIFAFTLHHPTLTTREKALKGNGIHSSALLAFKGEKALDSNGEKEGFLILVQKKKKNEVMLLQKESPHSYYSL